MDFADYSPPQSPSVEQQHDALRKGLGRALQWAGTGKLSDEPLLEACLHDLRFDSQVDDCRGAWLWQLLSTARYVQRFRKPIRDAFQMLSNEDDAQQLCELALHFAGLPDEEFRKRLYDIVDQKPFANRPWLAEEQIVALDGERGFLFAVRVRGAQLSVREWEWDDLNPVDEAIKRLGEDRVLDVLKTAEDEPTRRYRDAWFHHRNTTMTSRQSHQERMQAITLEEVIKVAETEDASSGMFRGWGMYANADDLEAVFTRLLNAREPRTIAKYLMVFSNRPMPHLEPTVFSLCQHPDETVRNRALRAVGQNAHPLVREFALEQLEKPAQTGGIVGLFIKNYQRNDERRLLDVLRLPDDQDELHWLLMEVVKVLEANPTADGSQLGVIAYATTPCASCRLSAARCLHKQHVAPQWLVTECRSDAEIDARRLEEYAAGTSAPDS